MAPEVHMEEAGDVIVLSSNNYLGLADQPEVVEAGNRGLRTLRRGHRVGALHLRNASIFTAGSKRTSRRFSAPKRRSRTSRAGTRTRDSSRPFATRASAIVSDELNHASIIDGVRLATKARRERYKHSNMAELEEKLKAVAGCFPIVVVTDGVFSMEGDLAKLPEIVELAKRYGAIVVVDDSHGTGVMGATGRGTIEHFGLDRSDRHHYGNAGQSARRRGGRLRRRQPARSWIR